MFYMIYVIVSINFVLPEDVPLLVCVFIVLIV